MKLKILALVLISAISASSCKLVDALFPGTWEILGTEGFSQADTDFVQVAVDEANGIIYAAFQEGAVGSVSVMKYEEFGSETWEYVGGPQITGETAKYISLSLDQGVPYISFNDDTPGVDNGLSVMMFNGTTWQYVGSPVGGGISTYSATTNSILVDEATGDVYVAYRESAGTTNNLEVSVFDGSSWQIYSGVPSVLVGSNGADYVDMKRQGGTTYVSYTDRDSRLASVLSSTGSTWSAVGGFGISNGDGESTALAIGDGGTPYVTFFEDGSHLSVLSFDGSAWSYVGGQAAVSQGIVSNVSMDYFDGSPMVAYKDHANNFRLSVQRYDSSGWAYVGDPGLTTGRVDSVSLAAGNAAYYVAFSDYDQAGAVTVMRYR